MLHRVIFAAVVTLTAAMGTAAQSQDGYPLTVVSAQGDERTLYLSDLDAMEQVEFTTTTIWTDREVSFSGVPLLRLLDGLGAEGLNLRLSALNDYAVEMPVSDLESGAPIVATRMDGRTMPVREKGPYWVIYPFDLDPMYRTEATYARSVWQLKSLMLIE